MSPVVILLGISMVCTYIVTLVGIKRLNDQLEERQ